MRRRDRAFWKQLVIELQRSELSHAEFARLRHVALSTLRSWVYRLPREDATVAAPKLLPVRVVASAAPSARWQVDGAGVIEAITPSGLRLRFKVGADLDYLTELIRRLG